MVEITLFRFDLDSVDFTANAPHSGESAGADDVTEEARSLFSRFSRSASSDRGTESSTVANDVGTETSSSRPNPIPVVLGLGLVVLLVVLGRRLVGGEPEPVGQ